MYSDFEQSPLKGKGSKFPVMCNMKNLFECAVPGELSGNRPERCSRDRAFLTRRRNGESDAHHPKMLMSNCKRFAYATAVQRLIAKPNAKEADNTRSHCKTNAVCSFEFVQ